MADSMRIQTIPWGEITLGTKLGEGGFGIVYRGTWKHGGEVAVKQIKGTLGADAIGEFRQEAEIMAGLGSPYIIRLFGICWEQHKYALVMELMPNASLYQLLHNGQELPWNIRYRIAQDIAYGLRLLHERKILHRDLKSLNVLLDDRLRAKLTDFGLAKVKMQSKTTSKSPGSAVGTVAWMAPELFDLEPHSFASDVYGYAMTAWELASREIPFSGINDNVVINAVGKGRRPAISPEANTSFTRLIESCWAQDASQRPTMAQVVATLEGIVLPPAQSSNSALTPFTPGYKACEPGVVTPVAAASKKIAQETITAFLTHVVQGRQLRCNGPQSFNHVARSSNLPAK